MYRLVAVSRQAVGISEAGLPFDAPDGQPAHDVFMLVTPRGDATVQLVLSANISRKFRTPGSLERALRAEDFTECVAALKVIAPR